MSGRIFNARNSRLRLVTKRFSVIWLLVVLEYAFIFASSVSSTLSNSEGFFADQEIMGRENSSQRYVLPPPSLILVFLYYLILKILPDQTCLFCYGSLSKHEGFHIGTKNIFSFMLNFINKADTFCLKLAMIKR